MTGHVFHPGHHALHGVTVVLETHGRRTYVGRFDTQDDAGVHLVDVGIHDADASSPLMSREDYLARTLKFGIRVEHKHIVVPAAEVAKITPLGSLG